MAYNTYEVRGTEVYPYVSDDFEDFMPVFEIQGSDVYPTIFNERDEFGLPMFEIRDGYAHPTVFNDHDDFGFDVPVQDAGDDPDEQDDSDADQGEPAAPSATGGELAAAFAIGIGLAAGAKAVGRLRDRRQRLENEGALRRQQWADHPHNPPPGWYPTPAGPRFWDGLAWTWHAPAHGAPPVWTPPRVSRNHTAVVLAWVLALLTLGYMLPFAVAVTRRSSNRLAVGLVCFFLSWTIVGWVVAFVMAFTGAARSQTAHRSRP